MKLSPKERLRRALRHEPVDRLPTQINVTAEMGRKIEEHFTVADDLPAFLGNHLRRVDLSYEERLGRDGQVRFDWWGAGFDTDEEGYFARVNPLAAAPDLDAYPWPDPHDPGLLAEAETTISRHSDCAFIVPNMGFALFERAWALRGFEQFFLDMAADPGYTNELLDRIVAIQLALIDRYLDLGVDGGYFGDDYGAQQNMLFSPRMWRRYIGPRLETLFAPFRQRDLPIIMHSDGQIQPILPDLVAIGLTTLNPVQPEVLDHAWLAETFGGQLAYYGGVSTQTVLPYGSPAEVRDAVAKCVAALAPQRTGLLLAPSHRLMSDIPMANVAALLDAFQFEG